MYTPEALIDIHDRAHATLLKLLAHCRELTADELNRKLDGFGYVTIRLQLHHMIGAEEYWVGVIKGAFNAEDNDDQFPTIAALEAYREQVAGITSGYLRGASADDVNTPRPVLTFQQVERTLMPAHIVLRTQMHIYQHQGQVAAMCRLLGKPIPAGLDFPITSAPAPRRTPNAPVTRA